MTHKRTRDETEKNKKKKSTSSGENVLFTEQLGENDLSIQPSFSIHVESMRVQCSTSSSR